MVPRRSVCRARPALLKIKMNGTTLDMANEPGAVEREVQIINEQGLHARPVMRLADLVANYKAEVKVSKGERSADSNTVASQGASAFSDPDQFSSASPGAARIPGTLIGLTMPFVP